MTTDVVRPSEPGHLPALVAMLAHARRERRRRCPLLTLPEERGTGVGSALTAEAAAEARRAGYTACFTDWRTTNPLSSAFWPARGFTPYLYRLVRRLAPQGDAGGREGG